VGTSKDAIRLEAYPFAKAQPYAFLQRNVQMLDNSETLELIVRLYARCPHCTKWHAHFGSDAYSAKKCTVSRGWYYIWPDSSPISRALAYYLEFAGHKMQSGLPKAPRGGTTRAGKQPTAT